MNQKALILAVDRNRRNLELLVELLHRDGYQTLCGASVEEMDAALAETREISLALIDICGFDESIWQRCERLRSVNVPFLIVTASPSQAVEQMGQLHGATGVLAKPLGCRELLELIREYLNQT